MQLTVQRESLQDSAVDLSSMSAKSYSDCVAFCKAKKDCQTISYCGASSACKLSTIFIDHAGGDNTKYLQRDTGCSIFTSQYI